VLLEEVEFEIATTREDEFNEWYHPHLPHLMTIPLYESARRFIRVTGHGAKYVALYELAGPELLPLAFSEDLSLRHPSALIDEAGFEALSPDFKHVGMNVYEPATGAGPFLHGNHPVALIRSDVGKREDWHEVVDRLSRLDDVHSAVAFTPTTAQSVQYLRIRPANLVLIELSGPAAATQPDLLVQALPTTLEYDLTTYRQIAWHASFIRR
jgi:hypothetical protein